MTQAIPPPEAGQQDAPASPRTRAARFAWISALAVVLAIAGWGTATISGWMSLRPIEPSGGRYFFTRVELPVPQFFQDDPRWSTDLLGPTDGTLGAEGCAVAASAMVLGFYGVDTDPGRLNAFLTGNAGYTEQGWIYWEKAAELAPERVRFVYENLPSYWLIDQNLARGNPVIVRLRYPHGITHFVVICGKAGRDYLIRDPGRGGMKGVYPLREFGSRIEALRFYQKL